MTNQSARNVNVRAIDSSVMMASAFLLFGFATETEIAMTEVMNSTALLGTVQSMNLGIFY